PGNFAIKADREKYAKSLRMAAGVDKVLKGLDGKSKYFDKKALKKYKLLKGELLHDPDNPLLMEEAVTMLGQKGN
ncbi:MAG: hypothetical protein HQK89_17775, partial [Nitrospirae bacterium]|nr:hypothetical protein [Nitrospirota bacterium]